MKETILIVEDDPAEATLLRTKIEAVKDADTELLHAETCDEAVQLAKSKQISYCALDLELPQSKKDKKTVGVDGKCRLGFEVLRVVLANNPHVEVRVLSKHTDRETISVELNHEFKKDRRIIDLNSKIEDENYADEVASDLTGLTALSPILQSLGIRVVHPLERRLARKLWKLASRTWTWPTPIVVLRGEPRAGKDRWAQALPEFRNSRIPSQNRVAPAPLDLGQVSRSSAGDSALTKLFGTRHYQNMPDSAGIFELATGHGNNHQVDYNLSNYAILSELGNLPGECQSLLTQVLDSNPGRGGRVTRQGAGNVPIHIGCGFIFTTNARLEERVVPSDEAGEGALRADLFDRLGPVRDWLFVPTFQEMGVEAFLTHLRLAIEREKQSNYEIAPGADHLIRSSFEDPTQRFSQESISWIVQAFLAGQGNRLTPGHVSAALNRPKVSHKSSASLCVIGTAKREASAHDAAPQDSSREEIKAQSQWRLEQIVKAGYLQESSNEYFVLKSLAGPSTDQVERKALLSGVNKALRDFGRAEISAEQLTTALKAVKRKLRDHPEWNIALLRTRTGYKLAASF